MLTLAYELRVGHNHFKDTSLNSHAHKRKALDVASKRNSLTPGRDTCRRRNGFPISLTEPIMPDVGAEAILTVENRGIFSTCVRSVFRSSVISGNRLFRWEEGRKAQERSR